jgi:predicted metal-dependent phosphoesterase TrpH
MIKEQGGLVGIPHPFDRLRRSTIHRQTLEELLPFIDIIEVLNSRLLLNRHVIMAERFAQAHGLLVSAGSDAHMPGHIGTAYVEMPPFSDRDQFLTSLAEGKIRGRRSNPWAHLGSTWAKLGKALRDR